MVRDYLIIAAEYRQAVRDHDAAERSVEQAESTWRLMRDRQDRSSFDLNTLREELLASARA